MQDAFEPPARTIRRRDALYWRWQRARGTAAALRALEPAVRSFAAAPRIPSTAPAHLVLVAHDGPDTGLWAPALGNISFETYQSAVEILGHDRVTLAAVENGEPRESWIPQLLDLIRSSGATHVLGQIERDPNKTTDWNWDVVAAILGKHWSGTFIAQTYDAGFEWLRMRGQRIAALAPRSLFVDLGETMNGYAVPNRVEVGPVTMPISRESLAIIDERVASTSKQYDVSFIGALYDYRVDLLRHLDETGFAVVVNPQAHAPDVSRDAASRPTYLDYLAALAASELTINFARASSGPRWHYKTRIVEAAVAGCISLTDDVDRTDRFVPPDQYAHFASVEALADVVRERLADRTALRAAQARARTRGHELATLDYWGRIDDGLRRRELPALTGLTAPPIA